MSYGIHISNKNNIKDVIKYGGSWIQLMIPNIFNSDLNIVLHLSYTINIAKNWNNFSHWIYQIINEINIAQKLNAKYVVLHIGKQKDLIKEQCYNNMITSLYFIHQKTKSINIKILLETPAGVGSDLCYKIEDLSYFFNKIKNHKDTSFSSRFGICIDICHIFVAGYDISKREIFMNYMKTFNNLIGINYIKLIHLNDSANEVGTRLDKHANLGEGYIGDEMKFIIDYFNNLHIPMITETKNIKNNLLYIKSNIPL